ncbi:GNAT family N-acetyltransferase [Pseudoalteromonas fenneropenaei]|uniref:GNAT family N-acetyltransferase n=1 Tax=Pseudoalteromonas fenneropenaei TaxID=1737459 RepID=A0ABV7CIC9_9GAMM
MKLVAPSVELEHAYHAFLADFIAHDPENAGFYEPQQPFAAHVAKLFAEQNLPLNDSTVPCHHFWFCDEFMQIIGALRVRHHIDSAYLSLEVGHIGYDVAPSWRGRGVGKQLLAQGLAAAKTLGLEQVLIIADEDNLASRKVIEANGGQLADIVLGQQQPSLLARYWCQL